MSEPYDIWDELGGVCVETSGDGTLVHHASEVRDFAKSVGEDIAKIEASATSSRLI